MFIKQQIFKHLVTKAWKGQGLRIVNMEESYYIASYAWALQILEDRMRSLYPGWTREAVTYHKHPDYKKAAGQDLTEQRPGSRPETQNIEEAPPAAGFIPVEGVTGEIPI